MRTLWRHNMACALIAQQIASAGTTDRDIAYTAGMLHGIGLLALAVVRPQEYIHLLGTFIGTARHAGTGKGRVRDRSLRTWQKLVGDWNLPGGLCRGDLSPSCFVPPPGNGEFRRSWV